MAALHNGHLGAAVGTQSSELNTLTTFLARHLQQQQASRAFTAPAINTPCSPQSGSAAGALTNQMSSSPLALDGHEAFECNISGSKSLDLTPTTSRRRKHPNSSSLMKLQALAEVSEDRLAKQEKRMMKNRESAARSRLRRQQHAEALEEQNKSLKSEVVGLRAQVCVLQGRVAELEYQLQLSTGTATTAATGAAEGQCTSGQPGSKLGVIRSSLPAPAATTAAGAAAAAVTKANAQASDLLQRPAPAMTPADMKMVIKKEGGVREKAAAAAALGNAVVQPQLPVQSVQAAVSDQRCTSLMDALAAVCSGQCPRAGVNLGGDATAAALLSAAAAAAAALMSGNGPLDSSGSQQEAGKPAVVSDIHAAELQQQRQVQQLQHITGSNAPSCSDMSSTAAPSWSPAAVAAAAAPLARSLEADAAADGTASIRDTYSALIQRLLGMPGGHTPTTGDVSPSIPTTAASVPGLADTKLPADNETLAAVVLDILKKTAAGSNSSAAAADGAAAVAAGGSARPNKRVCV